MSSSPYTLEKLAEARSSAGTDRPLTMRDIPPDAPMEEGITVGCWDGTAFIDWRKWMAAHSCVYSQEDMEAWRRQHQPVDKPKKTGPKRPEKKVADATIFD